MRVERLQCYKLHFHKTDCKPARDVFWATVPEQTVPESYQAYAQVFSEADLKSMPSNGSQQLVIELLDGKQPLGGPIYNLSKKKQDTLYSYLEV
jgi:hypothetical protein